MINLSLMIEVIVDHQRSIKGQSIYLKFIWSILTILEVKRSKKVIRGQIMVMRGHMVKSRKERLSHMISLGAQLSFDIHHAYVPKC